jgi:hypothetical protein
VGSYRGDHERTRRVVAKLVASGQATCARCGNRILPGQPWDLDHVDVPYVDGGGGRRLPSCRSCNRKAGSALGNARKRARRARRVQDVEWTGLGIEVAADRKATWVAQAGIRRSGHVIVKLLDPLPGAPVAPTLARLWNDLPSPMVGIDPRSPSATLVEPLRAEGVPLRLADARGMAVAHGLLLDLLAVGRLRVRGHPALDAAARQAVSRRLAGADAIERYGGVDLAPLVAAELACWALGDLESVGGLRPDQVTVAAVGQSPATPGPGPRPFTLPTPPMPEPVAPASTQTIYEEKQMFYAARPARRVGRPASPTKPEEE